MRELGRSAGLLLFSVALLSTAAEAATFEVSTSANSGNGSLRWAIEQANANPGHDTIRPKYGVGPLPPIALLDGLPPIKDTAEIGGITIDGSSAGPSDGLVIEGRRITVRYVDVENFSGDGIVITGDGALLEWVRSSRNRRGLLIGGSYSSVFGSEFTSNRSDGIHVTETSRGSFIGREYLSCFILCPPYAGPNEVGHNGGNGIRLDGSDSRIDSNNIGVVWNAPAPNGGHGILANGLRNQILDSNVGNNLGDGIRIADAARFFGNAGGCNAGPLITGVTLPPPLIRAVTSHLTVVEAGGEFRGEPNTAYRIELYKSGPCPHRIADAIGSIPMMTDASGFGRWSGYVAHEPVSAVYAIGTRVTTTPARSIPSKASAPFTAGIGIESRSDVALSLVAPLTARTGSVVELLTTVTNNGPAPVPGVFVPFYPPAGLTAESVETTSGVCYTSSCFLDALGAGEQAVIRHRLRVSAPAGPLSCSISAGFYGIGLVDPNITNNSAVAVVQVSAAAQAVPLGSPVSLLLLAGLLAGCALTVLKAA